ncbi:hypothetical protein D6783_01635 [Candidatus Woesearchaeota archaeon]|nr:MAG: hypothetical protein D6783_01635 [Candidatus Woesearchaeota archaeon]
MDVSNKTLGLLLIAAMLISLFGTFFSLNQVERFAGPPTGAATSNQTGNVTLTVTTSVGCTFGSFNLVDFGSGYVAGGQRCYMTSNGTTGSGCSGGLSSPSQDFILENNGNVNATVYVNSNATAAQFLSGSTSPQFQIAGLDNESGSCGNLTNTAFVDVNTSKPGTVYCGSTSFQYSPETADSMKFVVLVNFSQEIDAGAHQATIEAVCDDT